MPICYMPGWCRGKDKSEGRDKIPGDALSHQDWREPPGYLGEAVRRAKRISSRTGLSPASEPAPKDY